MCSLWWLWRVTGGVRLEAGRAMRTLPLCSRGGRRVAWIKVAAVAVKRSKQVCVGGSVDQTLATGTGEEGERGVRHDGLVSDLS